MTLIHSMLEELDREALPTRRLLERVPDGQLAWKPHPKSMTLGQLALHVAQLPGSIAEVALLERFPAPDFNHPAATSAAELVPTLDEGIAKAKTLLSGLDDAAMASPWTLVSGDQELFTTPRGTVLRSLMLNHWYHHRGQLVVYLRELNVPIPSIYGPTADENPFGV
jgi:uncharacterized damage-inducible protein DinB